MSNSRSPRAVRSMTMGTRGMASTVGGPLPDVGGPGLLTLFVGINPGLTSAARGHHFARPGNRFWPALHRAGFTPRVLSPDEDGTLPRYGLGITTPVPPTSQAAAAPDDGS